MPTFDRLALHGALELLFSGKEDERWVEAAQEVLQFALTIPESHFSHIRSLEVMTTDRNAATGLSPGHGTVSVSEGEKKEFREQWFGTVYERVGAYKLWRQKGANFVTIRHFLKDWPHMNYMTADSYTEYWLYHTDTGTVMLLTEALMVRKPPRWWMLMLGYAASTVRYLQLKIRGLANGSQATFKAIPFCFGVKSNTILRSAMPEFKEGDDLFEVVRNRKARS